MRIRGNIAHGYRAALATIENLRCDEADRSLEIFCHGTLTVKLYAPRGQDPQTPHAQDELYVIASGSGRFKCDLDETDFNPGDVLFVRAGEDHRFTDFSDDFAAWVFLYGPQGGEKPD